MGDLKGNDIDRMRDTSEAFMPLTCSLFRPTYTTKASGDRVKTYPVNATYENVPIDIIEVTGSGGSEGATAGGYQTVLRYEGYIPIEYDIQNSDRITDNLGRKFEVASLSNVGGGRDYTSSEILIALIRIA